MQLVFFFVTAIASLASVASFSIWLMWKQLQALDRILEKSSDQISTLTNLATAKDLQTFQGLQATISQNRPNEVASEPIPAMNDEAVAHALAQRYIDQGMDPSLAYAKDDGDDPLSDFGGIESFR